MSDLSRSDLPVYTPDEEEIALEPSIARALQQGLQEQSAPAATDRLNTSILGTLTSGRDFDPWWRQARTRLGWMLAPFAVGFALTWVGSHRYGYYLFGGPLPNLLMTRNDLSAPKLTPLPK